MLLTAKSPVPSVGPAVAWSLAALSGLTLWVLLYALMFSGFQESSAQHALYGTLRNEIAQEVAPLGGDIPLGKPVAVLRVPQAGINAVVLEGTTSGVLENGPGLEADTPLPGQAGVSVIFGRQTMFGGPFRHLSALHPGDLLEVTTGEGVFAYRVDDLRYPGDPLPPALSAGQSRMVLVTATGSGWQAALAPSQFLYVDTSLVGKTVGSPAGMPTAVPASQEAMHGDNSALMPLVLWLQLLLLTVVATIWVRTRWGGWQTWLVAAPALFALLWVVSETAFQLLPNLL
jgi:sortase A